jgi:hypothetical protein
VKPGGSGGTEADSVAVGTGTGAVPVTGCPAAVLTEAETWAAGCEELLVAAVGFVVVCWDGAEDGVLGAGPGFVVAGGGVDDCGVTTGVFVGAWAEWVSAIVVRVLCVTGAAGGVALGTTSARVVCV